MAWSASGLNSAQWLKHIIGTTYTNRYLINLALTTNKCALYDNTVTPNFGTTTAAGLGVYTTTGEVTSTNYTAGGRDLNTLNPTTTDTSGLLKFTHDTITWTSVTISSHGGLWYSAAVTSGDTGGLAGPAIVAVDFGATYTATAGDFKVTCHANGLFTIDLW